MPRLSVSQPSSLHRDLASGDKTVRLNVDPHATDADARVTPMTSIYLHTSCCRSEREKHLSRRRPVPTCQSEERSTAITHAYSLPCHLDRYLRRSSHFDHGRTSKLAVHMSIGDCVHGVTGMTMACGVPEVCLACELQR